MVALKRNWMNQWEETPLKSTRMQPLIWGVRFKFQSTKGKWDGHSCVLSKLRSSHKMPCEHWNSVRICTDSNIWHWDGLKFLASDFGHSFHSTSHSLPPTKRRHLRNCGIHYDRGARCDRCFYYGHEMTLAKVFWVNVTRWPWQCSSNWVHLPQFSGWK